MVSWDQQMAAQRGVRRGRAADKSAWRMTGLGLASLLWGESANTIYPSVAERKGAKQNTTEKCRPPVFIQFES